MFRLACRSGLADWQALDLISLHITPTRIIASLFPSNPPTISPRNLSITTMTCLKLLALVALAFHNIVASPAPQPLQKIDTRALDGAGIYLVDCQPRDLEGAPNSTQSWLSLVIVGLQGPHRMRIPSHH